LSPASCHKLSPDRWSRSSHPLCRSSP
jgi:hypothetical protein